MVKKVLNTVSETVDTKDNVHNDPVDLDNALKIAGFGLYNLKYSLLLSFFLISAIVEAIGYSYILPAAKCDLQISDKQRGIIGSIVYIGTVLSSFPWGYLVDTKGRKRIIIISSLAAGIFGVLAGLMPNLITFTIFKFLSALCIGCPSAVPYSFIGEIIPPQHRDITLSVTNAMQVLGSALIPLLAWAILPLDFRINFGLYDFRPWRLLNTIYSALFIICAIIMMVGPESPKYLISQGNHDESLKILQTIYSGNKRKPKSEYPVKKLLIPNREEEATTFFKSLIQQSMPLLKPPYLKWMILNGTLLFGLCSNLNGLALWIPELFNRIFNAANSSLTVCEVVRDQNFNTTVVENAVCDDSIDIKTFVTTAVASCSCAVIVLAMSTFVKILGKKTLLVITMLLVGIFCIVNNFITDDVTFAVLLSTVPMLAIGVGPINAYAVEIFPTHLRGMAISLTLMVGRFGSIFGGNIAGYLINTNCEATFYLFGGLLLICGLLSFLLPREKNKGKTKKWMTHL